MRALLAWLIAVPLALIGTLSGHALGYRAAVPDAGERVEVLATSGHGYLAYAPLAVALLTAVAALGFAGTIWTAVRGRESGHSRSIVLVAGIAPLAFVLQEFLERLAHDGTLPADLLVSAPFLLGLAAQLPFALLSSAVALALAATAARIGRALRVASRPRPRAASPTLLPVLVVDLPRERALARGYAGRGPPLRA